MTLTVRETVCLPPPPGVQAKIRRAVKAHDSEQASVGSHAVQLLQNTLGFIYCNKFELEDLHGFPGTPLPDNEPL